jgi:phosphatidylserine decarboxylase
MPDKIATPRRLAPEPLDPRLTSIQPGGGFCMRVELAWGVLRRAYLRAVRPGYVARMRQLRTRQPVGCPHQVLDPRDLKFHRNLTGDCWPAEHDPFAWRSRLPVARVGLAELLLIGGGCFILAALLAWYWWPLALVPLALGVFAVAFFRNPRRTVPTAAGQIVAPADGVVVGVQRVDYDEYLGGSGIEIAIFLSVFNVHINRVPEAARVIGLSYHPGKFLNALRPQSARENERLEIRLEGSTPPHRRMIVRQIAGAIARRIVCWTFPGEDLSRGAQFGMIKFGSRTELVLPEDPALEIRVRKGQPVRAGQTVMAEYREIV